MNTFGKGSIIRMKNVTEPNNIALTFPFQDFIFDLRTCTKQTVLSPKFEVSPLTMSLPAYLLLPLDVGCCFHGDGNLSTDTYLLLSLIQERAGSSYRSWLIRRQWLN